MLKIGKYLAVTATIVHKNDASAKETNLDLDLLSNDAWLQYGHREVHDYNQVSKKDKSPKASKAKTAKSEESPEESIEDSP